MALAVELTLGMRTTIVRLLALLFAAFFAYAAYRSQDLVFLVASVFFIVMVFLSVRNAGRIDSPYIYLAVSAGAFFYSLPGLVTGAFTWRGQTISIEQAPQLFWTVFVTTFLLGAGLLVYGLAQLKRNVNGVNSATISE